MTLQSARPKIILNASDGVAPTEDAASAATPQNVDQYIARYNSDVQQALQEIRSIIQKTVPAATERISYGMPAFELSGILVWYGAHQNHIGFYPKGSGVAAFKDALADYKTSKGAVQFPFSKPLPEALIVKMVQFREAENLVKMKKSKPKMPKGGV